MFQKIQFACSSASLAKKARAARRQMEGGQPRSQLWLPNSLHLRKWHAHEPCFLQSPSAACSLLQFARRSVDQLGDDICSSLLAVPRILGQEAFFFLQESMRRCLEVARFLHLNRGKRIKLPKRSSARCVVVTFHSCRRRWVRFRPSDNQRSVEKSASLSA
jgi:hypothetical protein